MRTILPHYRKGMDYRSWRTWEDAEPALAEGLEEGAVVEVTGNERAHALGLEPEVERVADQIAQHGKGVVVVEVTAEPLLVSEPGDADDHRVLQLPA